MLRGSKTQGGTVDMITVNKTVAISIVRLGVYLILQMHYILRRKEIHTQFAVQKNSHI